ncbi:MAG: 4-(cytidine 5'-diphospho)-2-C-methyl-D-erythritol kinase [Candidatus Zixiibacteriota bacterium]
MFVKRIDSDRVVIGAPAKLNLFLEVLERRPDGYHNINSLFQTVSLFDRMKVTKGTGSGIDLQLIGSSAGIGALDDNLVTKAYRLMAEKFDAVRGIRVELEKNIPIGAGLGGGSSDAAATILACNLLFDLRLSRDQMARMGIRIGADLPFFFGRGQALVSGRGEIVRDIELPTDYWIVLITPSFQVSTAASYAQLDLGLTVAREPFSLPSCRTADELIGSLALAGNDFEANHLVSYPEIRKVRDWLLARRALLARMSGSGPTVFGIYLAAPETEQDNVEGWGDWRLHTVRPITLGTY